MGFDDLVFHLFELIAALAGAYYYLKTKDAKVKPFVWFLWVVVFVETVGMYGYILQYNFDNNMFIWLKNSVFCTNTWLYNLFNLASIFFFGMFYKRVLSHESDKKIIDFLVIIYIVFSILYFILTKSFFIKAIPYDFLLATLIVFIFVLLYYKELFKSDKILFFYKSTFFYISSGLLLWHLCVSPLFIFNGYFYDINQNFVEFRSTYLLVANILLYSCYTFAFLYTLQFKKQ